MRIAEHLDLHVPGAGNVPLEEDRVVTEAPGRFALRRSHSSAEVGRGLDHAHALPTTARRRLHQERVSNGVAVGRILGGGQGGHARLDGETLPGELVAHLLDHVG